MIRWEPTEDGIVVLTLDDPEQSTNTMNARYVAAISSTIAPIARSPTTKVARAISARGSRMRCPSIGPISARIDSAT